MSVVVVTGTNTGVGKTVATAALAASAAQRGSVCVVKPVQTGVLAGEAGDVDVVRRLAGVSAVRELTRLADPLAPDSAAGLRGVEIPRVDTYVNEIATTADVFDTVIVEGAGGVLVRLDTAGGTIIDLAAGLRHHDVDVAVVVVVAAVLGTLNHSELTVAALRAARVEPSGLIIGSWPSVPDLAARTNLRDLPLITGVPVIGVITAGATSLTPAQFVAEAQHWLAKGWAAEADLRGLAPKS